MSLPLFEKEMLNNEGNLRPSKFPDLQTRLSWLMSCFIPDTYVCVPRAHMPGFARFHSGHVIPARNMRWVKSDFLINYRHIGDETIGHFFNVQIHPPHALWHKKSPLDIEPC